MIKKENGKYKVVSKSGKNLGSGYTSEEKAKKRLQQVEFFKRLKDHVRGNKKWLNN